MIYIVRNADGTIKTFSESGGWVLGEGETVEEVNTTFAEYASRLVLSVNGKTGQGVKVAKGSGDVTVNVSCPGKTSVALTVNGLSETVALTGGNGSLTLMTDVAGLFVIEPADKTQYCAAGEAIAVVEVTE